MKTTPINFFLILMLSYAPMDAGAKEESQQSAKDGKSAPKQCLLCPEARISFQDAEALAQKSIAGRTDEIELERRKDGVFYCVEIVNDGNEYEVLIDAKTGHVLKVDSVKPDTQTDAESSSSTSSDSKLQTDRRDE